MLSIVESRRLNARLLPPELLHVSLIGVIDVTGPLPVSLIEAVKTCAGTFPFSPFDVTFSSVAHFGGDVIVLRAHGDAALVAFREDLRQALWKAGVRLPDKVTAKSFAPHVTMARGDWLPEFAVDPISWTVDGFVLIDSWVGRSTHISLGQWRSSV